MAAVSFLTPMQLAMRWNIGASTLKQWRWNGRGPKYHKFGGRIQYYVEDIEKFEKRAARDHTSMKECRSYA